MTTALTLPGAPLASPTSLATQPPLGQAAVTTGARITPQALTANGEAQFRPQQLPPSPANQQPIKFPTQGGGRAALAELSNVEQVAVNNGAKLPNLFYRREVTPQGGQSTSIFLAQLLGQSNGVLQGSSLALFAAINGAAQFSSGAAIKDTGNPQRQQPSDPARARGLLAGTGLKLAGQSAAATQAASAPAPYNPSEPRPPLPAKRNPVRIGEANDRYRAAQLFARPSATPPLPADLQRSALS